VALIILVGNMRKIAYKSYQVSFLGRFRARVRQHRIYSLYNIQLQDCLHKT